MASPVFFAIQSFAVLQNQIVPELIARKADGETIRVWVTGCATGEEAYSIAILIHEALAEHKKSCEVQIFATDIDKHAIETARAGRYPQTITENISPDRLSHYFTKDGVKESPYRINKSIRDMMIFSEQNVIRDPPFSKLDLISCRNLLIYLDWKVQKKLIPLFHYALKKDGILFLGSAETIGEHTHLFTASNRDAKLFRRSDMTTPRSNVFGAESFSALTGLKPDLRISQINVPEAKMDVRQLTEKTLLQHYAVAAALVNKHGDILYLHGRVGQFLEAVEGNAEMNILRMGRKGLQSELSTAIFHVLAHNKPVTLKGLLLQSEGELTRINLTVQQVDVGAENASSGDFLLVMFEATGPEELSEAEVFSAQSGGENGKELDGYIKTLRDELAVKEGYLRAANDELRASIEQLQSTNEELQSANEELETSKEELQSVNEELATVNTELQQKVADLSRVYNDMNNLLSGTGIGTIFVDHSLCIQRFTPAITQVINLIPSDIGRPVGHIVSNLSNYDRLVEDVNEVLESLIPKEVEVKTKAGSFYLLHIRPYRTQENVIEGAVITFVDMTATKLAQEAAAAGEKKFRLLCESMPQFVWTCAADGTFDYVNAEWLRFTGRSLADMVGDGWLQQVHPEDRGRLSIEWKKAVESGVQFEISFLLLGADGAYHHVTGRNVPVQDSADKVVQWFGSSSNRTQSTVEV